MWMLLLIGAPPSTQNVWHGGRMPTLCDSGAQRQPWAGSVLAAVQAHGRGRCSQRLAAAHSSRYATMHDVV